MEIFDKLFGTKKLKTTDSDFGEIESFSKKGDRVGWQVNRQFLGFNIEILLEGDKDGISKKQKHILLDALTQEALIKSESENALREQFQNAEMEFQTLDKHFLLRGISVRDEGFEMAFQEKEGNYYFFNVHFKNNKQVGVSIDG